MGTKSWRLSQLSCHPGVLLSSSPSHSGLEARQSPLDFLDLEWHERAHLAPVSGAKEFIEGVPEITAGKAGALGV